MSTPDIDVNNLMWAISENLPALREQIRELEDVAAATVPEIAETIDRIESGVSEVRYHLMKRDESDKGKCPEKLSCCNCKAYNEDCQGRDEYFSCPHTDGLQDRCQPYKKDEIWRADCFGALIGCCYLEPLDEEGK